MITGCPLSSPTSTHNQSHEDVLQYGAPLIPLSRKIQLNIQTRYFLVKSFSNENIGRSLQHGVWATSPKNERAIFGAYKTAPFVILIFSVNCSSRFSGYALVKGTPSGCDASHEVFCSTDGKPFPGKCFDIKWIRHHELFFRDCENIFNTLNKNKPIKIGRDGQEISRDAGRQVCELIDKSDCAIRRRQNLSVDEEYVYDYSNYPGTDDTTQSSHPLAANTTQRPDLHTSHTTTHTSSNYSTNSSIKTESQHYSSTRQNYGSQTMTSHQPTRLGAYPEPSTSLSGVGGSSFDGLMNYDDRSVPADVVVNKKRPPSNMLQQPSGKRFQGVDASPAESLTSPNTSQQLLSSTSHFMNSISSQSFAKLTSLVVALKEPASYSGAAAVENCQASCNSADVPPITDVYSGQANHTTSLFDDPLLSIYPIDLTDLTYDQYVDLYSSAQKTDGGRCFPIEEWLQSQRLLFDSNVKLTEPNYHHRQAEDDVFVSTGVGASETGVADVVTEGKVSVDLRLKEWLMTNVNVEVNAEMCSYGINNSGVIEDVYRGDVESPLSDTHKQKETETVSVNCNETVDVIVDFESSIFHNSEEFIMNPECDINDPLNTGINGYVNTDM